VRNSIIDLSTVCLLPGSTRLHQCILRDNPYFRERLRDPPDESDGERPDLDDASGDSFTSEDSSSLLEETLDVEQSSSVTGSPQPSPTPAVSTFANATAGSVNEGESEILPGSRIQDTFPSALLSVAGSPEFSSVASISPVSLRDEISTPASALEAIAGSATERKDQSPTNPVTPLADGQIELDYSDGLQVPSAEPDELSLVTAAPGQTDNFSIASLPLDRPRSPIMSLLQPLPRYLPPHSSHLLQPLNVGCFAVLKRSYGRQIEGFMRNRVNHIDKQDFLQAYYTAHTETMSLANIQSSFVATELIPYDPERVLSKLNTQFKIPTCYERMTVMA
jgi:hypothetical protein